jgi:leucyl-tRNA synthetase
LTAFTFALVSNAGEWPCGEGVARGAQNPEIEAAVLGLDAVKQALGGKPVRKVIIVPMRIVNVVG